MAFCGYQSLGPWLFPLGDVARGSTGTSVQLPDAPGSPYVLNAWFDRAGDVAVLMGADFEASYVEQIQGEIEKSVLAVFAALNADGSIQLWVVDAAGTDSPVSNPTATTVPEMGAVSSVCATLWVATITSSAAASTAFCSAISCSDDGVLDVPLDVAAAAGRGELAGAAVVVVTGAPLAPAVLPPPAVTAAVDADRRRSSSWVADDSVVWAAAVAAWAERTVLSAERQAASTSVEGTVGGTVVVDGLVVIVVVVVSVLSQTAAAD